MRKERREGGIQGKKRGRRDVEVEEQMVGRRWYTIRDGNEGDNKRKMMIMNVGGERTKDEKIIQINFSEQTKNEGEEGMIIMMIMMIMIIIMIIIIQKR